MDENTDTGTRPGVSALEETRSAGHKRTVSSKRRTWRPQSELEIPRGGKRGTQVAENRGLMRVQGWPAESFFRKGPLSQCRGLRVYT